MKKENPWKMLSTFCLLKKTNPLTPVSGNYWMKYYPFTLSAMLVVVLNAAILNSYKSF